MKSEEKTDLTPKDKMARNARGKPFKVKFDTSKCEEKAKDVKS